jgi:hypothetical protein
MPTEPRQVPVSQQPDAAERRLHIHGIREMPAGYDAEVAELFRDLRAATALSEMDLAARVGTRPEVVQALEQGALYALPPWAETCRVVNAYGAILNLDVRPLLRRIYAQLEAGIVELQPKTIPDVPVMMPPESNDFGFASGNAGGGQAPNPLDIPWPPPSQVPPRQNARPPQPMQAPQAPRPDAARPQQAPWPKAAPSPQPQNAWPNAQAQPHPQAWPGNQPMPQAPRGPASPQQRPAAAQPMPPAGRPPQPRPQAAPAPQPQPRQAPQPQPQAQPQPQPQPARSPLDLDFTAEPTRQPEPEKKRRPALLKWGLVALILSVVGFGLWFALSQAPGPSGLQSPAPGTLDPDDPRSRKSDRLPNAFQ